MNLTPKAQAIEREFQNARAKANYPAFPEFARRYVKHNKDGIGKYAFPPSGFLPQDKLQQADHRTQTQETQENLDEMSSRMAFGWWEKVLMATRPDLCSQYFFLVCLFALW